MKPLALDLATVTGFAMRVSGDAVYVGRKDFSPRRGQGSGMRFVMFRKWLSELYKAEQFGIIYYEQLVGQSTRPGQQAQHQIYGGLMATMMAWCEENGIPYTPVGVTMIKKHATGKGNSNKEAMMAAAREKLYDEGSVILEGKTDRISDIDDNMADAYLLLLAAEDDSLDI